MAPEFRDVYNLEPEIPYRGFYNMEYPAYFYISKGKRLAIIININSIEFKPRRVRIVYRQEYAIGISEPEFIGPEEVIPGLRLDRAPMVLITLLDAAKYPKGIKDQDALLKQLLERAGKF
ncbi:hypothetical protein [Mahella australiensis]|uniref:Uncharacterized protein n=1 Tax=Mahella australiensis (strain DSM 15567 / CIP 107919 / 50-1 BON) TaxID=697281 RepID=F3ZXE4_MAHA5|nr:hypothetical protein [Mahella australiensis]AEE97625.1 hypothetical protein Mahau_2467 [Mahella australiensis 50-1 BON]